jgi:cytochrome c oxidase cbb3-type subunit III
MGPAEENRNPLQHRSKTPLLAALIFLALVPVSRSQQDTPAASPKDTAEQQEDTRAISTREFLGLGRLPDARMAAEGGKIFAPTCGFCHGTDARGASGPDLLRSPVVLDDNQGELIGPTVHDGRPAKGMPAFSSFTNEQLRDIAEYLHLQVELAANRGTYKALNVVTGDAKAGEAYFSGPGKCNTCHSVTGDLAHLGSKMSPSDLQQTFLYPVSRNRTPPQVTVTLEDGKAMSGTLKHLDDFYVAFYDAGGNYQSITLKKGIEVQVEDKLVFHRQMLDKYNNQQMHDLTAYLVTLK